jgi:tetratricopeptide (TPR) repeat protein
MALVHVVALSLAVLFGPTAWAEPFTPADAREVLERVRPRTDAADPRARELRTLRAALQREPRNAEAAAALVRRYTADALAEGDPRWMGYAQAALAPWWTDPAPPPALRVQRAVVLQYEHRFDEALADLDAAVAAEPANGEAWSWKAAIHMVRADYANARRACTAFAPLTSALIGSACMAYVDSLTGRAAEASRALAAALDASRSAASDERLWALTRLAEIDERRGDFAAAERSFRAALALKQPDVYLLAAYADFLLDRGRAGEALTLLADQGRADVLLLRLAIAARSAKDTRAAAWQRELAARFDAARARGDSSHEKEESRFALALLGDAKRALALARANHDKQREPADARILLEAALAARDKGATQPVLQWMAEHKVESVALVALVERARALP